MSGKQSVLPALIMPSLCGCEHTPDRPTQTLRIGYQKWGAFLVYLGDTAISPCNPGRSCGADDLVVGDLVAAPPRCGQVANRLRRVAWSGGCLLVVDHPEFAKPTDPADVAAIDILVEKTRDGTPIARWLN